MDIFPALTAAYGHCYGIRMAFKVTTIGFRLRKQRRLNGYSITYAARKIKVAPIRLSQWERDIKKPGTDNLVNLAVLYGVMVDELIFDIRQEAVQTIHGSPENPYGKYYKKIKEKPP